MRRGSLFTGDPRRIAGYAVQKLLQVAGGLKAYEADSDILLGHEHARRCPFCRDGHRLRLHGHYHRFALVPGHRDPVRLPVRRLFCPRTGTTVSLLPDFCMPRRQHGPAILGEFLSAYAAGSPLLAALRATRPDAAGHSVAESLRDGFLARAGPIGTYVAGLRARALERPMGAKGRRAEVAALLAGLCLGFAAAADALIHHGVALHAAFRIGLA